MSRSGYSDDGEDNNWAMIKWRGQVASAIRGKRGQVFLREMLAALDAMPDKRLIAHDLAMQPPAFVPPERARPQVCAIGSVMVARGVNAERLDPDDYHGIAGALGVAHQMVREIEWENDEMSSVWKETPEQRWTRMRAWVAAQIRA